MNDNFLREAVDARLSGLTFSPQMQTDTLRRARQAERPPHARRKLSYSLAFALLALLLAATAGAATYFGVLHFHHEQENNAVYQQHILPIGERLTGQSAAVTVNDAVFDGSSLSFSLDIAHLPGTPETYLFPRVTAMQAGQVIPTAVTGFQQVSEDESYGMGAVLLDCSFYDGIFMPLRGESQAESGHFNLDIALCADLPDPEQPVEWSLTFDEMRPVFTLEDAPYTVIEEDESGVSYSWINIEADCLAAYREGRVLLASESSMMEYAAILHERSGMAERRSRRAADGFRRVCARRANVREFHDERRVRFLPSSAADVCRRRICLHPFPAGYHLCPPRIRNNRFPFGRRFRRRCV